MIVAFSACLALPAAAAAQADRESRVSIVIVPRGTTAGGLATAAPAIAPGMMSAGLAAVPTTQTYLDISQGNRVFTSLYPAPLPPIEIGAAGVRAADWRKVTRRADDAPAEIDPGLLARSLRDAGIEIAARPGVGSASLIAVAADGSIERSRGCRLGRCPGVTVGKASEERLPKLVERLRGDDLLIAIGRPPPVGRLLALGIAGAGYEGVLASASTRIDGYVLTTDLAPTILDHYGIGEPDAVSGRVITSSGGTEAEELTALERRLNQVSSRRHPVLGVNVMIWAGLIALAALVGRRRGAALALAVAAVTLAWVPALLLVGAALEPSLVVERLLVGLGGPLLAIGTIAALQGRFSERAGLAAFALASAASVGGTALDVIVGSPLTALSLLGPNPALGVRFFGIGNELEAVIGALLALGSGAAVAAARPADPRRVVAVVATLAALAGVIVFAPGRWGADVGAAITFPAGAAGVVIAALGASRKRLALALAVPAGAVAALLAVDLAIGGDAHLSRSVLDAGGLEQLGQVVERRVRLGAASFERFTDSFFFTVALGLMVVAVLLRRRIRAWFEGRPAAAAGFVGGAAAAVIGALANDSGALLLMVGSAYLAGFAALVWATRYFTSDSEAG